MKKLILYLILSFVLGVLIRGGYNNSLCNVELKKANKEIVDLVNVSEFFQNHFSFCKSKLESSVSTSSRCLVSLTNAFESLDECRESLEIVIDSTKEANKTQIRKDI